MRINVFVRLQDNGNLDDKDQPGNRTRHEPGLICPHRVIRPQCWSEKWSSREMSGPMSSGIRLSTLDPTRNQTVAERNHEAFSIFPKFNMYLSEFFLYQSVARF